jgi:hypothetical protein
MAIAGHSRPGSRAPGRLSIVPKQWTTAALRRVPRQAASRPGGRYLLESWCQDLTLGHRRCHLPIARAEAKRAPLVVPTLRTYPSLLVHDLPALRRASLPFLNLILRSEKGAVESGPGLPTRMAEDGQSRHRRAAARYHPARLDEEQGSGRVRRPTGAGRATGSVDAQECASAPVEREWPVRCLAGLAAPKGGGPPPRWLRSPGH